MKPIEEVFHRHPEYRWLEDVTYNRLIESTGVEILLEDSSGDYQGDTRMILREGTAYGYLLFGWGSCSGCDALEGCRDNLADLDELRRDLYKGIVWKDSKEALAAWIRERDWRLTEPYEGNPQDFINQALKCLG